MKDTDDAVRAVVDSIAGRSADHLDRAVVARRIVEIATRLERIEVMAAREQGATWATVADAFGITTQTAHERFRSGPDGLHSRFDARRQSKSDSGGSGRSVSTAESSATRNRRSTRS
jgi:hypothetical protein